MASIKVILKENKKDINGEIPLYLRIIKDRKAKFISLGIKVKEKDWNPAQCIVKKSNPDALRLNNFITHKIAEAQDFSLEMQTSSKYVEPKAIKQAILGKTSVNFLKYADDFIENSKSTYSVSTYNRYKAVISKLRAYKKNADFTFSDLTPLFLKTYENHLRTKLDNSTNTIHANFKVFRRIIREAINDDLMPYDKNPFLKYTVKTTSTNIEFLTDAELLLFENLELAPDSLKNHHRNMYVFAAYAAGLRIGDLLTLKWSSFDGARLLVNTKKTNATVSFLLPDKALEIIEFYQRRDTNDSVYIFPFLNNANINVSDRVALHTFISSATAYTNTDLKDFAKKLKIDKHIHFHTSRHTFATRALRKGARIEYVSKLLGHASIKTTQIYAKIVNEDLDTVMRLFNEAIIINESIII